MGVDFDSRGKDSLNRVEIGPARTMKSPRENRTRHGDSERRRQGGNPESGREYMDRFMPQWRLHRQELNRAPLGHESWSY